jgi:hypothetical protein
MSLTVAIKGGGGFLTSTRYSNSERIAELYVYECQFRFQGRDGVVGIAIRYGLDGPRIEPRWGGGEFIRTHPDRP